MSKLTGLVSLYMARYTFILLLFLLGTSRLSAQYSSISGTVVDSASQKPVAHASVLLSSTTKGTQTSTVGAFLLTNIQQGEYELVVSCVGYKPFRKKVRIEQVKQQLSVQLVEQAFGLSEIVIKPDPDRDKYLKMFVKAFVGTSSNAGECKLINPKIVNVSYDKEENSLEASTSSFLVIENKALGYRLHILLDGFKVNYQLGLNTYVGKIFFEELTGTAADVKRWKRKRMSSYRGSIRHFYRSLVQNSTKKNGFEMHPILMQNNTRRPPDSLIAAKLKQFGGPGAKTDSLTYWKWQQDLPEFTYHALKDLLTESRLVKPSPSRPGMFELSFDKYLYLVSGQKSEVDERTNQVSAKKTVLGINRPTVLLHANGILYDPLSITYQGSSTEKIAELLPDDFEPEEESYPVLLPSTVPAATFINQTAFEKTYLHTDREHYSAGDTLWFGAYLVNAKNNVLVNSSNNLYAELIAPDLSIIDKKVIRMDHGTGNGDFALDDSLPSGNYRLRAYTRWMHNFSDDFVFEKLLKVYGHQTDVPATVPGKAGSAPESTLMAPAKPAIVSQTTAGFFPEGGALIEDVRSIVALKIEDATGRGLKAAGAIRNSKGDSVAHFESNELGTGSFSFLPVPGQIYRAEGISASGLSFSANLPGSLAKGYALRVTDEGNFIKVTVITNAATFDSGDKPMLLEISHAGQIASAIPFRLDSLQQSMRFAKNILRSGISVISVYDELLRPQAERLIFLSKPEETHVNISTDKTSYHAKEKTDVRIKITDEQDKPVRGIFSLAATDAGMVPANEISIRQYLLLKSEIKGNIENIGGYFDAKNPDRLRQLDLLMLTQGWRDFVWKKLADSLYKITYEAEHALTLSGRVRQTAANKAVAGSNITLSAFKFEGNKLFSARTDSAGRYRFDELEFYGSQPITINSRNDTGEKNGLISIDALQNESYPVKQAPLQQPDPATDERYLLGAEKKNALRQRLTDTIRLAEVAIKKQKNVRIMNQVLVNFGYPEESFTIAPADTVYPTLGQFLRDKLVANNAIFQPLMDTTGAPTERFPKLFVNGREISFREDVISDSIMMRDYYSLYYGLPMDKIGKIVVKHLLGQPKTHYQKEIPSPEGVKVITVDNPAARHQDIYLIYITLKPGALDKKEADVLKTEVTGYSNNRVFYAPKYEIPGNLPDVRTTIHWQTQVLTDENGEATLTWYNADPKTRVSIAVEGISAKGIPIAGTAAYEVK